MKPYPKPKFIEFIGKTWTIEAKVKPDGSVAGYVTRVTGQTVAFNDPYYPSNFIHIPDYVRRQLNRLTYKAVPRGKRATA